MHDVIEDVGRGITRHSPPLGNVVTIPAQTAAVSGKPHGVSVLGNGTEGFSATVAPFVGAGLII